MTDVQNAENRHAPPAEGQMTRSQSLFQRHRWLPLVAPLAVYMLVGSLEPTATEAGGARIGLAIPYAAYPLLYAVKIAITLIVLALVWPGLRYTGIFRGISGNHGDVPVNDDSNYLGPYRSALWSAVVGTIGVVLWIGLCEWTLPHMLLSSAGLGWLTDAGQRPAFNPFEHLADHAGWVWPFIAVRLLGLALVVPVIEEFFLRGFVMRFVMDAQWWRVPFGKVNALAVAVSIGLPMLTHPAEMLAAIVWFGMVTALMVKTRSLWACVSAHAVTNLLLGVYVLARGAWTLW